MMARVLIIGYGNPLRGDDAFGYVAAERLRQLIRDPEVDVVAVQQLTPELMEPLSRATRAVFLDAAAEGKPGTISERRIQPLPAAPAFTHFATPEALLAGARALYGSAPAALLLTVAGAGFEFGAPLSEPVRRSIRAALRAALTEAEAEE
jgi:hydrogenase maturation protease